MSVQKRSEAQPNFTYYKKLQNCLDADLSQTQKKLAENLNDYQQTIFHYSYRGALKVHSNLFKTYL